MAAVDAYNETGARLAGLHRTCGAWLQSYQRFVDNANGGNRREDFSATLLLAPQFREVAKVPVLGQDDQFVSGSWRTITTVYDLLDDILQPLQKSFSDKHADLRNLYKAGSTAFVEEYERLGRKLLDSVAILHAWYAEREALFAEAGEIAAGAAKPPFPVIIRGAEFYPWMRLSLPTLRAGTAPIWRPDANPMRLQRSAKEAA